mmetsp:Transcript_25387/g.66438  ORF Transcript_25387/g.66438 Transcript_25387/m.66438 type:complete len:423 (-) Transcript_25387:39-1307(-)
MLTTAQRRRRQRRIETVSGKSSKMPSSRSLRRPSRPGSPRSTAPTMLWLRNRQRKMKMTRKRTSMSRRPSWCPATRTPAGHYRSSSGRRRSWRTTWQGCGSSRRRKKRRRRHRWTTRTRTRGMRGMRGAPAATTMVMIAATTIVKTSIATRMLKCPARQPWRTSSKMTDRAFSTTRRMKRMASVRMTAPTAAPSTTTTATSSRQHRHPRRRLAAEACSTMACPMKTLTSSRIQTAMATPISLATRKTKTCLGKRRSPREACRCLGAMPCRRRPRRRPRRLGGSSTMARTATNLRRSWAQQRPRRQPPPQAVVLPLPSRSAPRRTAACSTSRAKTMMTTMSRKGRASLRRHPPKPRPSPRKRPLGGCLKTTTTTRRTISSPTHRPGHRLPCNRRRPLPRRRRAACSTMTTTTTMRMMTSLRRS